MKTKLEKKRFFIHSSTVLDDMLRTLTRTYVEVPRENLERGTHFLTVALCDADRAGRILVINEGSYE